MSKDTQIVIFRAKDGRSSVEVNFSQETLWLSLQQIADLFERDKSVISRHIANIFKTNELSRSSTVAKNATTAADGKTYMVESYSSSTTVLMQSFPSPPSHSPLPPLPSGTPSPTAVFSSPMKTNGHVSRGRRYQTSTGVEGAFQPDSGGRVLRNLKGITSKRDMDREEYDALVRVQRAYLDQIEENTRVTAALIRQMHRDWLGELYPWAGIYRTVELAKAGFSWPPAYLVERNMTAFEHDLLTKKTPCAPGPLARVLADVAEVHAELLLIHPFREGNGRLARWLSELMILQAGLPMPVYGFTGRGAKAECARYLTAVKRGYVQDYRPLVDFFATAVERGRLAEGKRT